MTFLRALAIGLVAGAGLPGCVQTGDFGRPTRSVWNDVVATTGTAAAIGRGEAVSSNAVTDDESELRNRAWRFLVPARNRPWLDRALAELVALRVVPADAVEPDPAAYFEGLRQTGGRSVTSSYRRLSADASADATLVEPFAAVAVRVLRADAIRLATLARTGPVAFDEGYGATARVLENRCLIAWVTSASAWRVGVYRYALDHMVIQAPQIDAGPTERAIARLAEQRTRLDGLGVPPLAALACLGGEVVAAPPPRPPVEPTAVLVRKG